MKNNSLLGVDAVSFLLGKDCIKTLNIEELDEIVNKLKPYGVQSLLNRTVSNCRLHVNFSEAYSNTPIEYFNQNMENIQALLKKHKIEDLKLKQVELNINFNVKESIYKSQRTFRVLKHALNEILEKNLFFNKKIGASLVDVIMYQKYQTLKNYLGKSFEKESFKINGQSLIVLNKSGKKLIALKLYDKSMQYKLEASGQNPNLREEVSKNGLYQSDHGDHGDHGDHVIRMEIVIYSSGLKYFLDTESITIKNISKVKYFLYLLFLQLDKDKKEKRYSFHRSLVKSLKKNFSKEDIIDFKNNF